MTVANPEELVIRWREVDWLGAVGEAVITLAGPMGAPLKLLLRVRGDLAQRVNNAIATTYEGGTDVSVVGGLIRAEMPGIDRWVPEALEFATYYSRSALHADQDVKPDEVAHRIRQLLDDLRRSLDAHSTTLRKALAGYFYDKDEIVIMLSESGIDPSRINLSGSADHIWFSILEHLRGNPPIQLLVLVYAAHKRKRDAEPFRALLGVR